MAAVIYLSGAIRDVSHPNLGWMLNPNMGNRLPAQGWWAMDNGCFSQSTAFSWEKFWRVTNKLLEQGGERCLFVVAPDIPFDADGTLARFENYLPRLQDLPVPIAIATQDGMGTEDIPWAEIGTVFVGGSTQWKLAHESTAIMEAARQRGKWIHVGRVNSLSRLRTAFSAGADSADGTYLKYGPDVNWPKLRGWLETMIEKPPMRLYG